ncbi:MAG: hydrolase [Candidatus Omnitrophota bacterium]|nr:hydrolase [Candidatus Omnitrophota bacterium]
MPKVDYVELLEPGDCSVIFIDFQPQMFFGVASMDRQLLLNNVVALAKAAKVFNLPVILTGIESKSFSGYFLPQIHKIFEYQKVIERSSMNSWEDKKFVAEVERIGRKRLIICALWTEVCLCFPVLSALKAGYEVYFVADASGGTSPEIHEKACQRMIQAGAVPVTWQQVMLEFQRDWARKETYDAVIDIIKTHSGAYGFGVEYAYTMVHKQAPSK